MGKHDFRATSEERPPTYKAQPPVDNNTKYCGNLKKLSSNYDIHLGARPHSPLIIRKSGPHKFWGKSQLLTPQQTKQKQFNTITANSRETSPFLYDRQLNKSFETANGLLEDNIKCQNEKGCKNSIFRRSSTPQLHSLYNDGNARDSVSSTWCCGNFVLKQWKKMNQHYWFKCRFNLHWVKFSLSWLFNDPLSHVFLRYKFVAFANWCFKHNFSASMINDHERTSFFENQTIMCHKVCSEWSRFGGLMLTFLDRKNENQRFLDKKNF